MINQTKQQTKFCLKISSQSSKKRNNNGEDDEVGVEKLRKEIEATQTNALSLCTEKVLLARQAYDLVSIFFVFRYLVLFWQCTCKCLLT